MLKKQKPHQRKELDAAVGQVLKVNPESHPRPVERVTTRDAEGGSENKLHGPNIAGNEFRVKRRRDFGFRISVVVGAAEVVAAVGAYQLAFVAGKAVGAGGADLAVVIHGQFAGGFFGRSADRTTLWEIAGKFIVENVGSVGEHG
jgi:hypothetical protein